MKGWMKKAAALLSAALCLTSMAACTPNMEDLEILGEPTMTVTFDKEERVYIVALEGLAKNVSGKNCEDGYLYVQYYDDVGDPVCFNSQWSDYIDADEIWHFYMECTTENAPTRFEIKEANATFVDEEE